MPIAAGLLAVVVAAIIGRAWLSGTNDPDSIDSVLYFQRIVAGQRLEVTVLTTPKPLLTLLYGAAWSLMHDWRILVWLTAAVNGAAVAFATRLAARLAGPAAGAFIAAALIASPIELTEVTHANSLPWALAGWALAGVAVTASPPRFLLAGVALLLAGMARTETWVICAAVTLALVIRAIPPVRRRLPPGSPSARAVLPVLLAWLAVPVQWVHDYLLTGNPLHTLGVPAAYTRLLLPNLAQIGPLAFLRSLVVRYEAIPIIIALAFVGIGYLGLRRRWSILIPLLALVVGVLGLLGVLAWRAVYVSFRYYEEPGMGLVFAAAIGAGALTQLFLRTVGSPARPAAVISSTLMVLLALALTLPGGAMGQLIQRTGQLQIASQSVESVLPDVRRIVESAKGVPPAAVVRPDGIRTVDIERVPVFVPGPFWGRIAIELGVPLTELGDSGLAFLSAPPDQVLRSGQAIYHDAFLDAPPAIFHALEVTQPASIGNVPVVPIAVRPGAYWLLRVER